MFTKAGLILAVVLVLVGYNWGRRKTLERLQPPQQPARAVAAPAQPRKEWLSVKVLLVIVIVLLIIAIFSSLGGRVG